MFQQNNTKRLAGVTVALLLLANTGCVVYERQTLVFAFPKGSKEVRALFVYEGMRVGDSGDKKLENAQKQLAALAADDSFFYLGHWMIPIEIEKIKPVENESEEAKTFRRFLKANLKVRAAAAYVNKEGRLCLVQAVTIVDPPKMFAELNAMISQDVNKNTADMLAGHEDVRSGLGWTRTRSSC